ncbi:DsbA family protein [Mucilaginibacter myungsuensis]|uniref:DsbA family protein n=1 Tax=Mucilaginibacter myungsuensis TaxID=649104 RepID=A0A929KZB9_9SPHI|nr:DsbA family protein [Mucilaginibacter myungsuensis]MBE9663325.1 DsbA family protein [Mucilaginibacter myungsuensis]MDN3600060.1 DsbA family protein [Mucilaginibacter myungsuensis]
METNNNPLLCDVETGMCELPGQATTTDTAELQTGNKPVKIIYFTDPICSTCWGIEPQLRKLKLEYGHDTRINYHMGGLLPDWSYNSGGISKPSDVAHHWDEVSAYYNMPIDGDVWLEDPLDSSYPPSIAFKAAQIQSKVKALNFLRHLREMVFLQKKNITKWVHISVAATSAGLDPEQLQTDMAGMGRTLFYQDLDLAKMMGVRGFPTIFITGRSGTTEKVYGYKPYNVYEDAIGKTHPDILKQPYLKNWSDLFGKYPTLTNREFAELSDMELNNAESLLNDLLSEGAIQQYRTKNGPLWMRS